jgi:hypothetical protein
LAGETCVTLGYAAGVLRSDEHCMFDEPWCTDHICDNRIDDQANGYVDCDDLVCLNQLDCSGEACGDAQDNDGDDMTDALRITTEPNGPILCLQAEKTRIHPLAGET